MKIVCVNVNGVRTEQFGLIDFETPLDPPGDVFDFLTFNLVVTIGKRLTPIVNTRKLLLPPSKPSPAVSVERYVREEDRAAYELLGGGSRGGLRRCVPVTVRGDGLP